MSNATVRTPGRDDRGVRQPAPALVAEHGGHEGRGAEDQPPCRGSKYPSVSGRGVANSDLLKKKDPAKPKNAGTTTYSRREQSA